MSQGPTALCVRTLSSEQRELDSKEKNGTLIWRLERRYGKWLEIVACLSRLLPVSMFPVSSRGGRG